MKAAFTTATRDVGVGVSHLAAHANGVRFHGLTKRYGDGEQRSTVLKDVGTSIAGGTFVSIIGRSGSGKSTLLRMLAGLVERDDGEISIANNATTEADGAGVRYVFQNYGESLLPWKTVANNVEFGLRHSTRKRPGDHQVPGVDHYLKLVGLSDVGHRYPWELSGGMQQRLAIARALASAPGIVLMDEPFGAVDALSRAKLQDMILALWAELGITVILVTHDIDEAIYLSDRVLVLRADGCGFAADLTIELPRPRSQLATRDHPAFNLYRKELYDLVVL